MSHEIFLAHIKDFGRWGAGDTSQVVKQPATLEEAQRRLPGLTVEERKDGTVVVTVTGRDGVPKIHRMMTSLNDEVGSCVKTADMLEALNPPHMIHLDAEPGQHVMIELGNLGGDRIMVYSTLSSD